MRCLHLNWGGEQCREQALDDGQLCPFHSRVLEEHDPDLRQRVLEGKGESTSRFPLIYRLAAAALLLFFFLQVYQTVRSWLGG